jgi:hypothetical protein
LEENHHRWLEIEAKASPQPLHKEG